MHIGESPENKTDVSFEAMEKDNKRKRRRKDEGNKTWASNIKTRRKEEKEKLKAKEGQPKG